MPGRKPLSRLQIGRETTNGTMVPATARMRWNGGYIVNDSKQEFIDESIGIFRTDRSVLTAISATLDVAETPATPEQLPYVFASMFGGPTTGTADGTGSSGFRYVTAIPATSAPANISYTIETGDDFEVERMGYTKFVECSVKGSAGNKITMSASAIAQRVERLAGGFSTTSIADVNDLVFGLSRLYLDPISSTFGTTAINNQVLGFEITFKAMWERQYTAEAHVSTGPIWTFAVFADYEISGKLTMLHDPAVSGAGGLKEHFRTQTPRLLRIDCVGAAYATPGTGTLFAGGRRGVRIDLPIKVTKGPQMSDENKVSVVTVEFESRYNSTAGTAGSIVICNEVSTLP